MDEIIVLQGYMIVTNNQEDSFGDNHRVYLTGMLHFGRAILGQSLCTYSTQDSLLFSPPQYRVPVTK